LQVRLFKVESGDGADFSEFAVDFQALINWIANPKTPPHLVAKFNGSLGRKPS
jgi:hypothetical protein